MYNIEIYEDRHGHSEVAEWIMDLQNQAARGNKRSDSLLRTVFEVMERFKDAGPMVGEPVVKRLEKGVYELRPGKYRIIICHWQGNTYVATSYFPKKTRKTPRREIEKAKRLMADWVARNSPKVTI